MSACACVVYAADYFQLPPIGGKSLIEAAVNGSFDASALIRSFVTMTLVQQKRSIDLAHTANIGAIRTSKAMFPLTSEHMSVYKELRAVDFQENPDWFTAPVVTTHNASRARIIAMRMPLLARQLRGLVYVWDVPFDCRMLGLMEEADKVALRDEHPELRGRFVRGSPCMELKNVAVAAGVCRTSASEPCACLLITDLVRLQAYQTAELASWTRSHLIRLKT
jgi:hypothetical protein